MGVSNEVASECIVLSFYQIVRLPSESLSVHFVQLYQIHILVKLANVS